LFPKDKALFLMCGAGGYAASAKALLIHLGWDPDRIYNIGGEWSYAGANSLEVLMFPDEAQGEPYFATWRLDYTEIDFARLHPLAMPGGVR
ncbi:MAG: hypothetical protein LBG81_07750, partial [Coriobacteriaceae bacterium]|nr:hypothetical protein [Coriobacteriaceae bacterium]